MHDHAVFGAFDLLELFVVADHHPVVPEVVRERIRHLLIEERQQAVAGVDQIHLDVQAAEDRRIFAADHPGAVNDDVARLMAQFENGVAVVDAWVIEIDAGRMVRTRAAGDHDVVGADGVLGTVHIADADGVGVDEARVTGEQFALIPLIEPLAHAGLLADDVIGVA